MAISRGVAAESIVLTDEVANTADEAAAVARLIRERGWNKIILVTAANHMPRAARQFRDAGVRVIPFPVDFHADLTRRVTAVDYLPNGASLSRTENAIREWYGALFYGLAQHWRRKG